MNYLIFNINLVLPIYLIILLGFVLKRRNIVSDDFILSCSTIVYYFALPVRLFQDVSKSDFYSLVNIKFALFAIGITVVSFVGIWMLAVLFLKDKTKLTAFVHSAFRGNYVYVGLPITQIILNKDIIPSTILIIAFVLPLYNILAVILFSCYNGQKKDIKGVMLKIIRDPMVLAVVMALPFSLFQVELPFALAKPLDYIGSLATPMALLLIGAGIKIKSFVENIKYIINASVFKVIIQPLIFVPIAVYLGFSPEEITTVYVLLATPTAMNAYIVTKKLGGDEVLGGGIILATIILSAIALPIGATILRILHII